jgi:hypothetical protein
MYGKSKSALSRPQSDAAQFFHRACQFASLIAPITCRHYWKQWQYNFWLMHGKSKTHQPTADLNTEAQRRI